MPLGGIFEKKKLQQTLPGSSSSQEREMKGQTFLVGRHSVTVERKLAEGGFAIVYIARCNRSNRLFALKRQFVNDQKQLEACKREIQIIKSLDHRNIVAYVDSCILPAGEGVFECMLLTQYYRHSVLALMNERLLKGRHLHEQEILRIFCDVCEAVSRLHHSQTPVIHRDLKVENILIDDRGVFVLCDFGSATTRVLSSQYQCHSVVEEEILKYTTLSYRAPEMIDLYSAKPITTKSDIWALGVMLYKLCYFTLPFDESALAIQNGSFKFPDTPEYTRELKALIRYLLEPDCERRPDIYQAASIAFNLSRRKCPVPNLNNVGIAEISDLLQILSLHTQRQKTSESPPSGSSSSVGTEAAASTTTVAPRQRPKGTNPSAGLALPGAKPWKQPVSGECGDSLQRPAPTPPVESETKMVESVSNPDLSSGSGSSRQMTPSHSAHSTLNNSCERVAPPVRPQDLGFTDLDAVITDQGKPMTTESPFHTVEPPEGPLVSLTPPEGIILKLHDTFNQNGGPEDEERAGGIIGSGAPSQSAPHLPPHPQNLLDSSAHGVRGHRHTLSDTSAVFGGGANRPSAFKPYRSSQPDVNATGELPNTTRTEKTTFSTIGGTGGEMTTASASTSPVVTLLGVGDHNHQQRTHSASEMESGGGSGVEGWNPFSNAPGFDPRKKSQMDDLSFGMKFDELPRQIKRRGSVSSTSNVKSSESLVMIIDEKDPFGAAPFNPPNRISSGASGKKDRNKEADLAKGSSTGARKQEEGIYVNIENAPADMQKVVVTEGHSALSTLANTIKHTSSNRYRKLVDTDDELEMGKNLPGDNNRESSKHDTLEVPNAEHEDSDSVGSASDLQKRMEMTSTDDSTGAPSEPEDLGDDAEDRGRGQNITYEHFDAGSSADSRGESSEAIFEHKRGGSLSDEGGEQLHDQQTDLDGIISNYHPLFLNSEEAADGLGHRPLLGNIYNSRDNFNQVGLQAGLRGRSLDLPTSEVANSSPSHGPPKQDDDELDEKHHHSFPRYPETLELNILKVSSCSTQGIIHKLRGTGGQVSGHVRCRGPRICRFPQQQQRNLVQKNSSSPVCATAKTSCVSPPARSQQTTKGGSSSGEEEDLYLSSCSRSSSKKGPGRKKSRTKSGPGRHRPAVDDGGEDELFSDSPPETAVPSPPVFPHQSMIISSKRKAKGKQSSKTGGQVETEGIIHKLRDICSQASEHVRGRRSRFCRLKLFMSGLGYARDIWHSPNRHE